MIINLNFIKIAITTIILLNKNQLGAQEPNVYEYFHGKTTEFIKTSVQSGDLSIKFTRFNYKVLAVEVRNSTSRFVYFSPNNITIIGYDGSQNIVETVEVREPGRWGFPQDVKVGPMAHLQFTYILNREIQFPAKLYYDGKVIAELSTK